MAKISEPESPSGKAVLAPNPLKSGGDQSEVSIRSGNRFDGGTDEDEKAGAGFGEGDDARRARKQFGLVEDAPDPNA